MHRSRRASYPCPMGKLSERFTDVNRSAVYRVRAAGGQDSPICVLLVSDAAALRAQVREEMVRTLNATAQTWGEASRAFFAVLVDPDGSLSLPPLYREKPAS
jgi:hypothetical protein